VPVCLRAKTASCQHTTSAAPHLLIRDVFRIQGSRAWPSGQNSSQLKFGTRVIHVFLTQPLAFAGIRRYCPSSTNLALLKARLQLNILASSSHVALIPADLFFTYHSSHHCFVFLASSKFRSCLNTRTFVDRCVLLEWPGNHFALSLKVALVPACCIWVN
jgi:hypothetical protein